MPTLPAQSCTDNPSYFSEKCKRCSFACLKDQDGQEESGTSRSSLSIPGVAAVAGGAAASIAGYPMLSAGLTVVGAAAIIARIIRR